MKISISQKLLFFSFIVLAGMGFVGYAVYQSNQKLLNSEHWVQHTEQVISLSSNILSLGKDVEIASRGFVITKDSAFLEPNVPPDTIFENIGRLRELTIDNHSQQPRIDSLNFYMHQYLDFSFHTVEERSKQDLPSPVAYNSTKQGKLYTDRLREITHAIQQEEDTLLLRRKETNRQSATAFNRFSVIMFLLMIVFTILLLIATGKYLLQNKEKEKRAAELIVANEELAFQNKEKEKRAAELAIANKQLVFQNDEKEKRAAELVIANKQLVFQNDEKEKRAAELVIANKELVFQDTEKEKRAAELFVANKELTFQNNEKEKRAAELIIANKELTFQNDEKEKRAAELIIANKELTFQNKQKENRAAELIIANTELAFQDKEKENRAAELIIANKELTLQNNLKEKRAAELIIANSELAFQDNEKESRAAELIIANKELAFQNEEKEKRAAELIIANKELTFQNAEKQNRADELSIAHKELIFQNKEKEDRAAELIIANKELLFQHKEKEKRAAELIIANKELAFQNEEKEKRAAELIIVNTELTKAENDIRKLNEDLEQKVIERTVQLESANKELESFSYSVSHDLRAPLRAVHGYARMLKEDFGTQLDPEATRVMNNIMNSAKKMGQLIDDLLAFSRLGRKELVKMNIPMHDMVTNLCDEIKNENNHRNIEFKIDELQSSKGDSVVIKQVWANLISNAVKYSKLTKKAIIEISSCKIDNEIVYSIKDNGAGFDMRYANKLFGVFQRLHSDENFEGTGVGLAIVHRIISKHGGRVWAESVVNEGAKFSFSLPVNTIS